MHWPLAAAALAAGVAVSLLALVFGLGILRLRGAFFALATIGINQGGPGLRLQFRAVGRRRRHLSLDARLFEPLGGPMRALWVIYFLIVAVMGLSLLLSYAIKTSKFGLGLIAIGQNEDAAAVLGVPTPLYKALAYSISAFLPAIAGGLYFFKSGIIEPSDAFDLSLSIEAIVMRHARRPRHRHRRRRSAPISTKSCAAACSPRRLFRIFNWSIAGVLLLIIVLFVPGGLMGWLLRPLAAHAQVLE